MTLQTNRALQSAQLASQYIGGNLIIDHNPSIQWASFPTLSQVEGGVIISNNALLATANFDELVSIGTHFVITLNAV